jgi:hypothetical protein
LKNLPLRSMNSPLSPAVESPVFNVRTFSKKSRVAKALNKKPKTKTTTKRKKRNADEGTDGTSKNKKDKKIKLNKDDPLAKFAEEQNKYFAQIDKVTLTNENDVKQPSTEEITNYEELAQHVKESREQRNQKTKASTSTTTISNNEKLSISDVTIDHVKRKQHPQLYEEYVEYCKAVEDFLEPISFDDFLEQNGIY